MKKYIEPIIHVLVWLLGYFLILEYVNTILDFRKNEGPFWLSVLFGTAINQLIFYTVTYWLIPYFLPKRNMIVLIIGMIGGLVGINLLETCIDFYYLVGHFSTEQEPFESYFFYNLSINFFLLILATAYALIKYWVKSEQQKRILLEEKLSTEMAFLKSQINPHFLFNVLNSIYAKSLQCENPDLSESIAKLSHLMRYMVYESNAEKVSLAKEVDHLKNFIKVHQLRLAADDQVSIHFHHDGDLKTIQISPMLLIPLVENAIKHGIHPSKSSVIDISLSVQQHTLHFTVKNTMHQASNKVTHQPSGFGLDNLEKRLSILYPNKHKFEISESEGYFTAILSLQLH